MPTLRLTILPQTLVVGRLDVSAPAPAVPEGNGFYSLTRTAEEWSIVAEAEALPAGARCEPGWRAFKVEGPLDFGLTGILAALATPLAEAGISIFALSTFDTDYVLVRAHVLDAAADVLRNAGHHVV